MQYFRFFFLRDIYLQFLYRFIFLPLKSDYLRIVVSTIPEVLKLKLNLSKKNPTCFL